MAPSLAPRMTSVWPQLCPIYFLPLIVLFPSLASFSTVHWASHSRRTFSFIPIHTITFDRRRLAAWRSRIAVLILGFIKHYHSSYHLISEPSVWPKQLDGVSGAPLRLVECCERRLVLHSRSCCYHSSSRTFFTR